MNATLHLLAIASACLSILLLGLLTFSRPGPASAQTTETPVKKLGPAFSPFGHDKKNRLRIAFDEPERNTFIKHRDIAL